MQLQCLPVGLLSLVIEWLTIAAHTVFLPCRCQTQLLISLQIRQQTHTLMHWGKRTLNSSNTCLPRCNWLDSSWTQRDTIRTCHQEQRGSTQTRTHTHTNWHYTMWISYISKEEEGDQRTYKEGSSHASVVQPAGRQWDGNLATVYGSRNKLLLRFLELSHEEDEFHICMHVFTCLCSCLWQRGRLFEFLIQKKCSTATHISHSLT